MAAKRFDPSDLIGPPFSACPRCRAVVFGMLMIFGSTVTRRCKECGYTGTERLPALRKKIIYLDQMAYSNMAKTLDPIWAAERRPQEPLWSRMFDALERAFKLQLIVCPTSTIHERESALAQHPSMVSALYEHLSGGASFTYPVIIHQYQLCVALGETLRGEPVTYNLRQDLVIHGDPHEWLDRISIRVNMAGLAPDPAVVRDVRSRSYLAMLAWFQRWQGEHDKSFADWFAAERRALGEMFIELFVERAKLLAQVARGAVSFSEEVWNPRLEAGVVAALLGEAEEHEVRAEERLQIVVKFLRSEEGLNAPANDLSAALMASLARKAASGQKRPPSPGMWNDVMAISSFLPYCDAMFVDNECAGLLNDEPLKSKVEHFGTRIFSLNTVEAFLQYLAALELEVGPDHLRLVENVYGDKWSVPYREVLIDQRTRS